MVPAGLGFGHLDRLGVRLVLLLGLALLPIGVIAMVQTYRVIQEANSRIESSLLGETLNSVAAERRVVTLVTGMAQSLAAVIPTLLENPQRCARHLAKVVADDDYLIFAGFTAADGSLTCASHTVDPTVPALVGIEHFMADPKPSVTVTPNSRVTNEPALLVVEPVFVDSRAIGFLTLSVPHTQLTIEPTSDRTIRPLEVLSFDNMGTPLTSDATADAVRSRLPQNRALSLLTVEQAMVFHDFDGEGLDRIYTLVPLVQGQIYTLAVWPSDAGVVGPGRMATAVAFPILMWLASLAVGYIAVHRLVIRHIRTLRRNIRTFTATRRVRPIEGVEDVPMEMREVIEAFGQMTERILLDEADQENLLHEKDVLLKEVHHRVKNNLQLIASITNMQIRRSTNPETRFMLRRLQDRVMSLATVHRNLYQASVLSEVRADTLVAELARQMANSSVVPGVQIEFRLDTEPVLLYPDQAVPLSLLLTEAVTNAFKYLGRPKTGHPWVSVSLRTLETRQIELSVQNSIGPVVIEQEGDMPTGLGSQLIGAFVMQLGGVSTTAEADGAHEVRVTFDPANFTAESD